MKKLIALFLSVFAFAALFTIQAIPSDSQLPQEDPKGELTKKAEFIGGDPAMYEWLFKHMRMPGKAYDLGVSGKIVAGFKIRTDGSVGDVHIREGLYPLMDAELLRLYGSMPNWNPGMKNDVAVNTTFTLPIKVNTDMIPYKVLYPLVNKSDLSDMLTDALKYLVSNKQMGDLKIDKGKVKDYEGEVKFALTLKQKPQWWDACSADGTLDQELFKQTIWPLSPDFKTECMKKGVIVKCSVKPEKDQPSYDFEVKGDLWEYDNYDPNKKEKKE